MYTIAPLSAAREVIDAAGAEVSTVPEVDTRGKTVERAGARDGGTFGDRVAVSMTGSARRPAMRMARPRLGRAAGARWAVGRDHGRD